MIEEYQSLVALTREYLVGSPTPSKNIVIYAPHLSTEETGLIQKLTEALTKKVAPAECVTKESEIGSPHLLITTEILETESQTLFLSDLQQYLQDPQRKRTLWTEILNAF